MGVDEVCTHVVNDVESSGVMQHANTQAVTYLHPECTVQVGRGEAGGWTHALD